MKRFFSYLVFVLFTSIPAAAIEVIDFGAVPNDGIDDSISLQLALDSMLPGDILTFDPGQYDHSQELFLNESNVIIDGLGARLHSTNASKSSLTIEANNVTVKSLHLTGVGTTRLAFDRTCGLLVYRSTNIKFLSNRLSGFAGCGIMLQTTDGFLLQGNVVFDTLADAIHMTNKSKNGIVQHNTTFNSGDDGIAMVGYVKNNGVLKNINVNHNKVLGNRWGRGITVEGVYGAIIDSNYVENTSSAGIILASSGSYNQYGIKDVIISNNKINSVNFNPSVVHGGILISFRTGSASSEDGILPFNAQNVTVMNNTFINTVGASAHLRISANTLNISVIDNDFNDVDSSHIPWIFYGGSQVIQNGNSYNGVTIP